MTLSPLSPDPSCHKAVFSVHKLCFGYDLQQPVLDDIDFMLLPGQSIGLSGGNGSGKTTFFRCVSGLEKIWSGEIFHAGKPVKNEEGFTQLRKNVGFSVQNAEDQLFFATALEDVMFGPLNLGMDSAEAEERGRNWLSRVGLQGFENRQIAHLSGGQQKLLALAGILAMEPAALLLDEPFNGLDENAIERICSLIESHQAAKIIVCHDNALLKSLCPQIFLLKNGKLKPE